VSLKEQYRKFNAKCQICGVKVVLSDVHDENRATVDHKIPLSKGGLHVEDNVQLACWKCNCSKADTLPASAQLILY
jgi:5-methylcytosine-specific restriction endonuclease McrA